LRLSTKGQYAVRAIVTLACHSGDKPVTLKDISTEEGISLSYLEQLFVKLRKGKVVRSVRGPGGGYVLARPSSEISVGTVIKVVEEPLNPVACLDDGSVGCERAERCITQRVWRGLADKIAEFLDSITIEDLSNEVETLHLNSGPGNEEAKADLCNAASDR
jgi:Rrf2 family iron-sulfur cluster assembly transcriptional regulator